MTGIEAIEQALEPDQLEMFALSDPYCLAILVADLERRIGEE